MELVSARNRSLLLLRTKHFYSCLTYTNIHKFKPIVVAYQTLEILTLRRKTYLIKIAMLQYNFKKKQHFQTLFLFFYNLVRTAFAARHKPNVSSIRSSWLTCYLDCFRLRLYAKQIDFKLHCSSKISYVWIFKTNISSYAHNSTSRKASKVVGSYEKINTFSDCGWKCIFSEFGEFV